MRDYVDKRVTPPKQATSSPRVPQLHVTGPKIQRRDDNENVEKRKTTG